MRLVSDWVTSLRISPRMCTRHACSCFILVGLWFHGGVEWWIIMSSNVASLVVDKSGAATSASTQLPGTFLGLALDFGSDRLYDLVDDIPDVMGL